MKFSNNIVREPQVVNLFEYDTTESTFETTPEAPRNIQPLETPTIEMLIDSLPESFPQATEIIKRRIAPLMTGADEGVRDHYVTLIKKRTNAASKHAVKILIQNALDELQEDSTESPLQQEDEPEVLNPEILERVEEIKLDPLLFKKRIDLVNLMGVKGERLSIGLNILIIDSAKQLMGQSGSDALAGKNFGPQGSGKSKTLFTVMVVYSPNDYYLITSGSSKSLYNMDTALKHKALILTEALTLEERNGDNELAYAIRSLVSEGMLTYQYTGFEDGKKVTKIQRMAGPTSLITTTIRGRLEEQLEDRLIQFHPDTSDQQTRSIINTTAEQASGNGQAVDENEIKAWREFHASIVPCEVVVPFASDIAEAITKFSLPLSARRGFKRVISATKTVTLVYQYQRSRDEEGRLISEMSDYAIAYQLMREPFRESLGQGKRYTDARIEMIKNMGPITPRGIAEREGVSGATISEWMKPWTQKGVLVWCDEDGVEFPDRSSLEKAKRTGKANVRFHGMCDLPSPYDLTRDERWAPGGELQMFWDLGLGDERDEGEAEVEVKNRWEEHESDEFEAFEAINVLVSENEKGMKLHDTKPKERIYSDVSLEQLIEEFPVLKI